MGLARLAAALGVAALSACATAAPPPAPPADAVVDGPIPVGNGQQVATVDGVPLPVFTFKPQGCPVSGVLLVFHGVDRNAGPYRDDAVPLAQLYCTVVVAPLFDATRFPSARFQRGGVTRGGVVLPTSEWTVRLAPGLAAWARAREGRADLPYDLLGHSAGAQFLSRVAAYGDIYGPGRVRRIVIANPSTWVRPNLDVAAPYGFGGLGAGAEAALRRYLAAPIAVLLGGVDTGSRNLASSDEAEEQGANRLDRGRTVFAEAEAAARAHGWAFGWRLAVVPGVGHNARAMFTSDAAFEALRPGPAR